MDTRTSAALEGSIKKWEAIVAGQGEDRGSRNCPLCQEFPSCEECPVKQATERRNCGGTPYSHWLVHQAVDHSETEGKEVHCHECWLIARQEVEFLKGLWPAAAEAGEPVAAEPTRSLYEVDVDYREIKTFTVQAFGVKEAETMVGAAAVKAALRLFIIVETRLVPDEPEASKGD